VATGGTAITFRLTETTYR